MSRSHHNHHHNQSHGAVYEEEDPDEYSDDPLSNEHGSLTHAHEQEQKGLTHLLGNPNASSIAKNGRDFGGAGNVNNSGVAREGMEVEDDEDSEVEIDSDLEENLPNRNGADGQGKKEEVDQPQICSNWIILYFLGVLVCLACEFLILLPAFYLRLFVVGLMYGIIWLSIASCAVHMSVCPGKKRAHSTLALALYISAFAAYVGGMGGAWYYKQAWYFDQIDTAYNAVNPQVDPLTGADYSSYEALNGDKKPTFLSGHPTFLEFETNLEFKPKGEDKISPLVSYVHDENFFFNSSYTVGLRTEVGHNYCVAPIIHSQIRDFSNPVDSTKMPIPRIFFWAVGIDCCGRNEAGQFWSNCKYWGDNSPTIDADGISRVKNPVTDFSAEVIQDQDNHLFREAILEYIFLAGLNNVKFDGGYDRGTGESYLVEVMSLVDHYGRQTERINKAYICFFSAAVLWPVLAAVFAAFMWLGKWCLGLCASNPHRMS